MQFIRRNINKSLRNGEIVATQTSSSYYKSSGNGGGGVMSGDFLPATSDENGVYIVPHYVTFQETTTTTDTDGNETETIKNLLEITKDGIIVNGNIIASGEVSAYGSGSTSDGSNVDIDLSNYYTKDEVDDLIDNIDVSGIDLTEYSKTSHTHSNYALTSHTHSGYALTSHTHHISAVTDLQSTLDGKVPNTAFTAHTASTTVHITSDDRNKWNSAYTHISDSVTHVTESDKTNWNNKLNKSVWDSVFYIDDSNNLRVKLNLIGEKDVSAYGSGETGNTSIDLENYYTKEEVDDLISNVDIGDIDLSGYSKTSHTHSNYALTSHTHSGYALTSHTHPISAVTNLQSTLDGKSSTSHTHNNYSLTSHTHTQYASSSHTHAISAVTNLQSTLDTKATNAALTAHTANTTYHITSNERTKWNEVYTNLNDWFYKDSNGNIHSKYTLIGDNEISAYGSGETGNTSIDLENYYTKDEVNDLIDNIDTSDIDLSGYSKTSHTHSNYALTSHTHSGYALTSHTHTQYASSSHTHAISAVTNLQSTLDGKSNTSHTHSNYSLTSHTHSNYSTTSHTHNYASTVKVGSTSYSVSANTISLPSYPTLSSLSGVSTSTFNTHSGNTTLHITATERTNWDKAHTNNHTHSNKSVLDGITSTKVSNWDTVYSNWNKVFSFDSSGNLKVSVNVIGEGEISAYGSGTSTSSGAITIVDNLTSTLTDAALSANQGRVLKNLIDNIDVDNIDLSDYSKTSHTHSNYSLTSHTHSGYASTSHTHSQYASSSHTHTIANITNLQSTLDGKSGTGHTHSNYSPTSHTHSNYSLTSHTHSAYYDSSVSRTKNTVLAAPNGSDGTATFRALVAADIPSLAISKITNLQTTLDGKSGTGHSHSNYSLTSHTHSAYASTGHTHSSLTFSGGTFSAKTYNPSGATTVNIPTHTSHITNNSGYITSGATVAAANKVTSTLTFSGGTFSANTYNGSAAKTIYIPTNTTHLTNGSGYITSAATVANATKFGGYTMRSAATWVNNSVDANIQYTIDATSLSTSSFYPIIFPTSPKDLYVRMYSTAGNSSLAYNQNKLEFTFRGQGWTDAPQGLTVHYYNCYSASETTIGCIGMGQEGGVKCIWVRGGVTYYIVSNMTPSLKSSAYTNGNEVFSVGSNYYGGTNTKVTIHWTPQTTSGLGTLYHSGGLTLGGGLSISGAATLKSTLAVTSTSTFTGKGTFNDGIDSTNLTTRYVAYNNSISASVSSAGWYRFGTSTTANNAGGTYIFSIRRNYSNTNNEAYIICCTVDYGKVHWCQLNGSANTKLITQVRATFENNGTMYFDLYYSGTVANNIYVNSIGNCNLQTPTKTTTTLTNTKVFSLTDGIKLGTTSAYPITVFRDNSTGGAYIQYGAVNQLTKTWAAGSDASHQFSWYYKDTDAGTDVAKMWLTSDAKLNFAAGVGSRKLVVNGNSAALQFYSTTSGSWAMGNFYYNNSGTSIGSSGVYGTSSTLSYHYIGASYSDTNAIKFYNTGNVSSAYWMLNNTTSNPYLKLIHTYNSTTYTHYLQGYQGYLCLGTTSTKSLKIDNSGNCVAAGEVTAHSDKRLKSDIKPLKVRGELNPVSYIKDGKESIGFIADEVKEQYPELVTADDSTEEKYLSLNYAQLTAVLYAEIKELKERINKLENK